MMQEGVGRIVREMYKRGELARALCLGGAEGTFLGAAATNRLPVRRGIVSPSASGLREFGPFTGCTDVAVMHSVVDILGLNPIARAVFDNAAAAVVGMAVNAGAAARNLAARSVGVTMLGQTTPGAMAACEVLERAGWEPVIFHANGVGGPAMEDLAAQRALGGVIEFSLSELANSLFGGGIHATDEKRLTVAGRLGIPHVVTPGWTDFFNQGPLESVPDRWRTRQLYKHNPVATLLRVNREEMAQLGRMIARRLSESKGPTEVVVPVRGYSLIDIEGGPLWDHEADMALVEALEEELPSHIPVMRVALALNDPAFGRLVAERFVELSTLSESPPPMAHDGS
jgi:uncharacterized protein (UPF0261 family)